MRVDLVWRGGRAEAVEAETGETILDAAERAGVPLPFGCRRGVCATCAGKRLAGDVDHLEPARALKERHRRAGYVLTCIATPTTDCRIEVGADVQTDLVKNPWK